MLRIKKGEKRDMRRKRTIGCDTACKEVRKALKSAKRSVLITPPPIPTGLQDSSRNPGIQ
jgi:hypothetical protein